MRTKLATYNVQNLGRQDLPEPTMYRRKLDFIVRAITGLDADLVVVNELREQASFFDLAEACGSYSGRLLGDARPGAREVHTGILTRLEVLECGQWREFPATVPGRPGELVQLVFSRPVPWVKVRLGNGQTLFAAGVHLKSRRPEVEAIPVSESARRREVLGQTLAVQTRMAEAGGLRCLLDEVMVGKAAHHFAVLGDFNDPVDSMTVSLVCGRRVDDCEAGSADSCLLFPVELKTDGRRPYSYVGSGGQALIDHILVSQDLLAQVVQAGVETRLLDPGLVAGQSSITSDHAPVWVEVKLTEQTGADVETSRPGDSRDGRT